MNIYAKYIINIEKTMSNFNYKKKFIITDAQAKDLQITIETPIVCFYQDTKGRIYLTASHIRMHNKYYADIFDCTLTKEHWIIDMYFPFPWEDDYKFVRKSKGIYQLMQKEIKGKEYIEYVKPKTKTLSTARCRKTTKVQSVCKSEPSPYRKDPDLFDTLQ